MRLCALGDLLLDVIVRLERPLETGADTTATTSTGAGGQSANVAAWATALGAEARFIGKRGGDAAARLVQGELEARGVEVLGPSAPGRNGVVVSLVGPDGDRTMASDRGVAPELRPEEVEPAWLDSCDWLHVSGYCLVRSPVDEAAFAAASAARERDVRISLDLSAWTLIHAFGATPFRGQVERLGPNLVFANEAEWELVGGRYALAETAVVKRGSRGIVVWKNGLGEEYAAAAAEIVDTTGAGDALAAGFLVGGPKLGLEAAARCVAKLGAMP